MTVCNMSHRGGRPRRDDRAGPGDVRLPQGPSARAERRGLGRRRRVLGDACAPTTTPSSTPRSSSTPPRSRRSSRGAPTPGQGAPLSAAVPDPAGYRRTRRPGRGREGPDLHGPEPRARRCARSPSTPCSSAPAPTAGSRTCAPPPAVIAGRTVADGVRMLVVPGSMRVQRAGRGGGPRRGLHRGGRGVASGRMFHVPGHEPRPARPGRAQRVDVEPQLRGPPGQGWPHPPGLAARRRRDGRHRPAVRPADLDNR